MNCIRSRASGGSRLRIVISLTDFVKDISFSKKMFYNIKKYKVPL